MGVFLLLVDDCYPTLSFWPVNRSTKYESNAERPIPENQSKSTSRLSQASIHDGNQLGHIDLPPEALFFAVKTKSGGICLNILFNWGMVFS